MALETYFNSVLGYIERRQLSASAKPATRTRRVLNYAVAFAVQAVLFWISYQLKKEPEVAFALLYLISSVLSTLFLGYGAGLLAAILAASSVNYHYVMRQQALVSAHTVPFLFAFIVLYGLTTSIFWLLTEAVRRQNQAKKSAEDAVFLREELLQVIAHDLRQPLGAVMMQVELRSRMAADSPRSKTLGDDILKNLKRMDRLVSDILDSAKADQGSLKLNLEMADLKEVVEQALAIIAENAKRKQVAVSFVTDGKPHYYCWIDFDRMTRVLINLLGNALKFTPSDGKICIEVSDRDPQTLQVKVSDTGPGVSPEEAKVLFTKNWQNQKTAHLGNGLGLYICKGIIQAHYGEIWYEGDTHSQKSSTNIRNESHSGQTLREPPGAVFIFSLPKQQVFASQSSPELRKPESRKLIPTEYREYSGG